MIEQEWSVEKSIDLPPKGLGMNILIYEESRLMLEEISKSSSSSWNVVQVPRGFGVIDVVLVDDTDSSSAIYGVQITRSLKPFAKHHTLDTCTVKSKAKLERLWRVISDHFKIDYATVKKFYVMLAPYCEKNEFKPPMKHSNDFYFSPTNVFTKYDQTRARRHRYPLGSVDSPKQRARTECRTHVIIHSS